MIFLVIQMIKLNGLLEDVILQTAVFTMSTYPIAILDTLVSENSFNKSVTEVESKARILNSSVSLTSSLISYGGRESQVMSDYETNSNRCQSQFPSLQHAYGAT